MIYAKQEQYTIYNASCLDVMDSLEENSIDCIVTDPPYEINFMNKGWDNTGIAFNIETWQKALRVLKPGGYLLAFNHSRTFHRMMVAIEDAGFELRDTIMWLYGSGFPKSHNISMAIDKKMGVEREVVGVAKGAGSTGDNKSGNQTFIAKNKYEDGTYDITAPATEQAKQWDGWGTALKPAFEPIVMARKPFKTSVAENVLEYGVGGINIDECRVYAEDQDDLTKSRENFANSDIHTKTNNEGRFLASTKIIPNMTEGRFPANIIHDGNKEATKDMWDWETDNDASRYFYCAKASKKDRDEGLDTFEEIRVSDGRKDGGVVGDNPRNRTNKPRKNIHPTVKPTELMQYLVRLVAPKGSTVLDIFMGSGSTGKATMIENVERDANYHFIGVDLQEEYCEISQARIEFGINYKEIEEMNDRTYIVKDKNGNDIEAVQESIFDILGE